MIAGDDLDRLRGGIKNRETPPLALSGTLESGCKNVGRRGGKEDIDFGRKRSGGNQTKLTQYPLLERTCARMREANENE